MSTTGTLRRRAALAASGGLLAAAAFSIAQAQAPAPLRIGLLEATSGYLGDLTSGMAEAMQLAIADANIGRPVQIIGADHQMKPDVATQIAQRWYDVEGVKMITGLGFTPVALAVRKVAREKGLIDINTGALSPDLTGPACSETGAHWHLDIDALANVVGGALVKAGGDNWFFLTSDYAFGVALEQDATKAVTAAGGKVLGAVRHPLNTIDFFPDLVRAQTSGAKVVGLATSSPNASQIIKQASQIGVAKKGQRLAGFTSVATDVQSLTLAVAQGLVLTESFYWDLNEETRAWTRRFRAKQARLPSMLTANAYSATLHYLKAVKAAGTDDAKAVMKKMRELPVNDATTRNGKLRADGQLIRDMYLFQVKAPSESTGKDDLYKLIATVPGEQAFLPLGDGKCPRVGQAGTDGKDRNTDK